MTTSRREHFASAFAKNFLMSRWYKLVLTLNGGYSNIQDAFKFGMANQLWLYRMSLVRFPQLCLDFLSPIELVFASSKTFVHISSVGTSEFFDNLARASQFFAENESTGVLDALSQVCFT